MPKSTRRAQIFFSFLAALLVHAAIALFSLLPVEKPIADLKPKEKKIVVRMIDKSVQDDALKQIVQTKESENNIKKDAKYLSEKNNYFDRNTIAKNVDKFNEGGKGGKKSIVQKNKELALDNLKFDGNLAPMAMPQEKKSQEVESGDNKGNNRGVAASNDYINDVALGDLTQLNTQEFKYYGYYLRIRQKLEQFWGMSLEEKAKKLFRTGRQIASDQDLITNLEITVDAQGEIVRIKVLGSSGYQELDEAAIESFNKAGPFPNPPTELVKTGSAVIKWGFVVKS
jgi:TonB family protein